MVNADLMHRFLHNAHVFASTVHEIMGEKYLRETVEGEISVPQLELLRLIERNGSHQVRDPAAQGIREIQPAAEQVAFERVGRTAACSPDADEHDDNIIKDEEEQDRAVHRSFFQLRDR